MLEITWSCEWCKRHAGSRVALGYRTVLVRPLDHRWQASAARHVCERERSPRSRRAERVGGRTARAMSQENVEKARTALENFDRRDFDAGLGRRCGRLHLEADHAQNGDASP